MMYNFHSCLPYLWHITKRKPPDDNTPPDAAGFLFVGGVG